MLSNTKAATPKSTTLNITSYALKGPPLDFQPDVHLNARRLINPPSELRKAFDGRCEGLRKNLRADPVFNELLAEAQPQIFKAEETRRALLVHAEDNSVQMVEIKVAVVCVRGRHRSAAVAEELAKLPVWPEHYDVRVHHRDVDTPHRYQTWHQQNFEREQRGETVDVNDHGVESEPDDEDSGESESATEEDRHRSEAELHNAKWRDECKEQLSKVDSKELLKSEEPTDPKKFLHISSEEPERPTETQAQTSQQVLPQKAAGTTDIQQTSQHIPPEKPEGSADIQTQSAQHITPKKPQGSAETQIQTPQHMPS